MNPSERLTLSKSLASAMPRQKSLSGFVNALSSGGKNASFFDLSDYSVITNGYITNPYVYSVVNRLASLMALLMTTSKVYRVTDSKKYEKYKSLTYSQKMDVRVKSDMMTELPGNDRLKQLLNKPNPQDGKYEFWQSFFINKLTTGQSYIEGLGSVIGRPSELWVLPPLGVTLFETNNFYNKIDYAWFTWKNTNKRIDPDDLLHSKYFNPIGSVYGLSPLSAARKAVQGVNDAEEWNASLLQNGAKPEYVIVVHDSATAEQRDEIKDRFKRDYQGPYNAAKEPIVTNESFMKFEQLGYTLKDMDWVNTTLTNMRKVYDVYGVNSEAFNDPDKTTMANKKDAMRSMYTDRIMPECESVIEELNRWLVPKFHGDDRVRIELDTSQVDALNDEMDKIAERHSKQHYLTYNEKRAEIGKEAIEDEWANRILYPSNLMPSDGMGELMELEAKHTYNVK